MFQLKKISLSKNITRIEKNTFKGCHLLSEIEFSSEGEIDLQYIEYGAFEECMSLKSITIPEGVKIIGPRVFYRCISLKTVILPNSLISIGYKAFANTRNLTVENWDRFIENFKKDVFGHIT